MSRDSELIQAGKIIKPHGVRGGFVVYTDLSVDWTPVKNAILKGKTDEEDFVLEINITRTAVNTDGNIIIECEEIKDRNKIETLRGTEFWFDKKYLGELTEKELFLDDMIGMEICSPSGRSLGKITSFMHSPAPYPMAVIKQESGEIICPLPPQHFIDFDYSNKKAIISEDFFTSIHDLHFS
ncbi:ribosome maturation factor RimM [Myxococcota bacterium]|nr:ribosome maturation factor RimM [Myxococcota bacterium]